MQKYDQGLTLVETAVALLIIAIIFSLITYGQSLITQSHTRAVISEFNEVEQLIQAFNNQYNALPGDFDNASNTFGCSSCDGNSNGIIEWTNTTNDIESLFAWEHLYYAKLYNHSYPGSATTAGQSDIGVNIPASSWPNAGIEMQVGATTSTGITGNGVQIAGFTASSWAKTPNIMTPHDAWSIDIKIDDGVGQSGRVLGFDVGTSTSCVGTDGMSYNLSYNQQVCYIRYLFFPNFGH